MKLMILGTNPNMGFNAQQKEAIRKLEIIQIKNWKYIKPFLQDFLYYACKAGGYHDQALGERLFLKLPTPIGHEIHQAWNSDPEKNTLVLANNNITTRIQFIIDKLVERCTRLKGDHHLKGEFSFCNEWEVQANSQAIKHKCYFPKENGRYNHQLHTENAQLNTIIDLQISQAESLREFNHICTDLWKTVHTEMLTKNLLLRNIHENQEYIKNGWPIIPL